ncbi:MAG: hypothetical protein ACI4ED_08125 [Suilimivivens sp.]
MKIKKNFSEFMMTFFVCTTCITILEGTLGMIFFPQERLPYGAFFSPPLFGFFSVLFGLVTKSKRELSIKQILFRRGIHLLLIEGMVFGLNYYAGMIFEPLVAFVLALSIAFIFVAVYVIMWLNDQRSAALFNEKLKLYQNREA